MKLFNLLFIILISSACAYQLGYRDQKVLGRYSTISFSSFKNNTQETGAEVYFYNALTQEFYRSQVAQIKKRKNSRIQLRGTIKSIEFIPITQEQILKSLILNTEYRVLVTVVLSIFDKKNSRTVWKKTFLGERIYSAAQITQAKVSSSNPNYDHAQRHEVLRVIAKELMSKVHNHIVEKF